MYIRKSEHNYDQSEDSMYKGRDDREWGCLRSAHGSRELRFEASRQGGKVLTRGDGCH